MTYLGGSSPVVVVVGDGAAVILAQSGGDGEVSREGDGADRGRRRRRWLRSAMARLTTVVELDGGRDDGGRAVGENTKGRGGSCRRLRSTALVEVSNGSTGGSVFDSCSPHIWYSFGQMELSDGDDGG
ncbi:hypothetical protein Dimus_002062 [Dionaea muscipula]